MSTDSIGSMSNNQPKPVTGSDDSDKSSGQGNSNESNQPSDSGIFSGSGDSDKSSGTSNSDKFVKSSVSRDYNPSSFIGSSPMQIQSIDKKTPSSSSYWGWDSTTDIIAAADANEASISTQDGSLFSQNLTKNFESKTDNGDKKVCSLYDAYLNSDKTITFTGKMVGSSEEKTGIFHPVASDNLHPDGWVPKDQDPDRISKAILVQGANKSDFEKDYRDKDITTMKDKLVNDYGLKYDPDHPEKSDIQILKTPTKKQLKDAMEKIQNPGSKNSQVMIYYTGHGGKNLWGDEDTLFTHGCSTDTTDLENLNKNALQYDVKHYLGNFGHKTIILDCCNGGEFTKK